jgi:hypothetical protein
MLKKFQHDSDTAKVSIFDHGLWTFHRGIISNYLLSVQRTSYTKNILSRHVGIDPVSAKKAHFLQAQENGKEEILGTRVISYFALMTSRFAKILMLDAIRVSCDYRENTK